MNSFDKYLLLSSLSFFFACLAISLVSLYLRDNTVPNSYMPPPIEAEQSAPIDNATRQYNTLPKSVLHYPTDKDSKNKQDVVTCYLEKEYEKMATKIIADGGNRVANGVIDGEDMEIYVGDGDDKGHFTVFVIGPDAIGQKEACKVAEGTGWRSMSR